VDLFLRAPDGKPYVMLWPRSTGFVEGASEWWHEATVRHDKEEVSCKLERVSELWDRHSLIRRDKEQEILGRTNRLVSLIRHGPY
jgi:hypothetical protein